MDLISIPYPIRFQHFYIPGSTGVGKTTQLLNFIVQDIANGCGITLIDPKGKLAERVLDYIPQKRINDVFYLTLKTPIPFDFLSFKGPHQKDEMVEDIIYLLLGDAGNAPRAKDILSNTLYTLFSSEEPICFLDIVRFLTESDRRTQILSKVTDAELASLWKSGVPKDDRLEPILSRLNKYRRNSVLRQTFGVPHPPLNIREVMNNRKILLVNLGGASRAAIDYGSLLFMKIKQEAFRRYEDPRPIPHFVFIDEFQKFARVEDFVDVLEMAREYKIAMMLANPLYKKLPEHVKDGLSIVGSRIIFRLGHPDVSYFKHIVPLDSEGEPIISLDDIPDYHALYDILKYSPDLQVNLRHPPAQTRR